MYFFNIIIIIINKIDESCIPKEALLVKVPSIINPYYMRMYEVDNHAFKANAIRKKLEIYAKKNLNFQKEVKEMLNLNDVCLFLIYFHFTIVTNNKLFFFPFSP